MKKSRQQRGQFPTPAAPATGSPRGSWTGQGLCGQSKVCAMPSDQPAPHVAYASLHQPQPSNEYEELDEVALIEANEADAEEGGLAAAEPKVLDVKPLTRRHWLVRRSRAPATAGATEGEGRAGLGARLGALLGGWDDRSRTTAVVNCCSIAERVDEQLLPALYRFVGQSFQATPSQLGILTLSRAVVQALASPLAGILGHFANRISVLTAGAMLWALCTACFAGTHSVKQGIPFWAMNGVGLSFLLPTAQSLIADYNIAAHRGKAFGLLYFTGAVGALLGALFATNVGAHRLLGMDGWRLAFLTVAAASALIGTLTWLLAVDPRYTSDERYRVDKASDVAKVSVKETAREVWRVISTPSFLIIVAQGTVGSTPWNALVFMTFYLQLLGMSDFQASMLLAAFLASGAVGGLIGGFMGDWAARLWPDHGRVAVCQLSVAAGVPLSFLLFKGLPLSPSTGATLAYAAVLIACGLLITWAAPACNNPILSEIVPVHLRNLIFSYDRSLEGAIAAMGAPLVGYLAEKAFGFKGAAETTGDTTGDLERARSLGSALLVFTTLPWALCVLFFSGLHWTYPQDRRRAEEQVLALHPATMELAELQEGSTASTWAARSKREEEEEERQHALAL